MNHNRATAGAAHKALGDRPLPPGAEAADGDWRIGAHGWQRRSSIWRGRRGEGGCRSGVACKRKEDQAGGPVRASIEPAASERTGSSGSRGADRRRLDVNLDRSPGREASHAVPRRTRVCVDVCRGVRVCSVGGCVSGSARGPKTAPDVATPLVIGRDEPRGEGGAQAEERTLARAHWVGARDECTATRAGTVSSCCCKSPPLGPMIDAARGDTAGRRHTPQDSWRRNGEQADDSSGPRCYRWRTGPSAWSHTPGGCRKASINHYHSDKQASGRPDDDDADLPRATHDDDRKALPPRPQPLIRPQRPAGGAPAVARKT
ncbi:hypothetical protein BDY21DRAFT_420112 [Lineolata rhizophorae]|uniref:Uncharacterized protein n=1 Tax=Lineolata rhizophorae TaxID=578093 RepID=A0A6A6P6I3_9PEZI|nr:hypothetical protein BDY21DRAFT_420112 [Lineolata rhizophorae]